MEQSRGLVQERSKIQFKLGDNALEIEPMGAHGGSQPGSVDTIGVEDSLRMFAEDIGVTFSAVKDWRWVSSRWPRAQRRAEVPHYIHRILASIVEPEQRFAAIDRPLGGQRRWSEDGARRVVGWQVSRPETVQEKVVAGP